MSSQREFYDHTTDSYLLLCDNENVEYEAYTSYNNDTGLTEMLYRAKIIHTTNPEKITENYHARFGLHTPTYERTIRASEELTTKEIHKEFGLVDELQKETDDWLVGVM